MELSPDRRATVPAQLDLSPDLYGVLSNVLVRTRFVTEPQRSEIERHIMSAFDLIRRPSP
jgi:hypothetical protein